MKEISEENQWRIFELLEGNLSQQEQQKLLNEIDQKTELKKFYLLLKQTYLTPEKVEYPNKKQLLKTNIGVVNFSRYIKYAAAAAVIGVAAYIQFFKIEHTAITKQSMVIGPPIQPKKANVHQNKIEYKSNSKFVNNPIEKTIEKHYNTNNIKPLKSFTAKGFNPSIKLIEEHQFLNQLLENDYLSSNEKKDMMLKWLILNSKNQPEFGNEVEPVNKKIPVEVKVVSQDILSPEELENQELNEIWVSEAKQMLKKGKIPKMKLVSTKKENQWMPKFELEIQTASASLVKNILE